MQEQEALHWQDILNSNLKSINIQRIPFCWMHDLRRPTTLSRIDNEIGKNVHIDMYPSMCACVLFMFAFKIISFSYCICIRHYFVCILLLNFHLSNIGVVCKIYTLWRGYVYSKQIHCLLDVNSRYKYKYSHSSSLLQTSFVMQSVWKAPVHRHVVIMLNDIIYFTTEIIISLPLHFFSLFLCAFWLV